MNQTLLLIRTRLRIANNYLSGIRSHLLIHLAAFIGAMIFLITVGTSFFFVLFNWLSNQEDFGVLLMHRLLAMVMMAFLSMLVFSNLIITLSTTYVSRDTEYLMAHPIRHQTIFFVKLMESIFYSSWAFAILSLPLFVSYGVARAVPLYFYPLVLLLVLPFLLIPACVGALVTMVLAAFLPARRALKWVFVMAGLVILGGLVIVRVTGMHSTLFGRSLDSFTQVLNLLKIGSAIWSPHFWATRGMIALGEGRWREFGYWLAMLVSTALMLLQVCAWLADRFYYRGWNLARETGGSRQGRQPVSQVFFDWMDRRLRVLPSAIRAIVMKDAKTFLRDPVQWSQLVILFGLLFIYVANLRSAYFQNSALSPLIPFWQTLISFFNMGATCFMLSILTTRFVYPMLSLEGQQFWIVGLAPVRRTSIVWEKYWLCWTVSFLLAESLMLFSNWILQVPFTMTLISTSTLFLFSFGLTSLAVGLGAATPNFREGNPARIANGLGGTLNVILSMVYIGAVIGLEVPPYYMTVTERLPPGPARFWIVTGAGVLVVLIHAAAIITPMVIGLRRWRSTEF